MRKAGCTIEEVPYCFSRSSIKFQGHTGSKIDDLKPVWIRLLGRSQLSNPSDLPYWRKNSESLEFFLLDLVLWDLINDILELELSIGDLDDTKDDSIHWCSYTLKIVPLSTWFEQNFIDTLHFSFHSWQTTSSCLIHYSPGCSFGMYHQTSNIRGTLVRNNIFIYPDVVGAAPTSSFST